MVMFKLSLGYKAPEYAQSVQLIPLTLLREAKKIKANLRFGDIYQLPPPPSESARSNYSEFGGQLQRSLFERALRYHPAAATLNIQYRMHPKLSKFPSKFTYKSRLLNGAGCENIVADPVFSQRLAKPYLPLNYVPDEDFSRLLGINVANADIDTNIVTSSRSNPRVAKIVSELLHMVFTEPPYPTSTITIVTPYNAQRALYLTVLRDLQVSTGLPYSMLPKIATVDSMQGHESDIVILDWASKYGDNLGFLKDDRRANVALTRARACLIVLFSADLQLAAESKKKKKGKGKEKREVIAHWDYLVEKGLDMSVKVDVDEAAGDFDDQEDSHGDDALAEQDSWAKGSADWEGQAGHRSGFQWC